MCCLRKDKLGMWYWDNGGLPELLTAVP
jgi:hypothetical protein